MAARGYGDLNGIPTEAQLHRSRIRGFLAYAIHLLDQGASLKDVAKETRFAEKLLKAGPGKVPFLHARKARKRKAA